MQIIDKRRNKLTPHEFFIIEGKKMERAFTGKYWWVKDMGTYSCKTCTQKLFITEHKVIINLINFNSTIQRMATQTFGHMCLMQYHIEKTQKISMILKALMHLLIRNSKKKYQK